MLSKQLSEKVIGDLFLKIPEFKEYAIKEIDEDFFLTGYMIMDYFADYLKGIVIKNTSQELVNRCFSFINKVCELENQEIEAWLKETFFESLIDGKSAIKISRENLKGKALVFFDQVLAGPFFRGM